MAEVIFFIAAIGAVAGAVGTVALRNPFYAVLALVCHLLALAALFLLLRAEFVAAAQVVVYAGAVMVLYVFVVAYVGGSGEPLTGSTGATLRFVSIVFAFALFVELTIALVGTALTALESDGAPFPEDSARRSSSRRAVPHPLPRRVRDRVAAAADRGRRRGHPRAAAQRAARRRRGLGGRHDARRPSSPSRQPGSMIEAAIRRKTLGAARLVPRRLRADLLHRRRAACSCGATRW